MTDTNQPQQDEQYFVETIARYTNSPRIPELAKILARYVEHRPCTHEPSFTASGENDEPVSDEALDDLYDQFLSTTVNYDQKSHKVLSVNIKGLDQLSAAINTLRAHDYLRGRTDEAKTCEETKRHDYKKVIAVAELRGRLVALRGLPGKAPYVSPTGMMITVDEMRTELLAQKAQLEGKQNGGSDA